jgi:hypothetical protein
MLESRRAKLQSATRTAKEKFALAADRDAEFRRERQKQSDAEDVKVAKLRGLRLAKEAADRDEKAREDAEKQAAAAAKRAAARPARAKKA